MVGVRGLLMMLCIALIDKIYHDLNHHVFFFGLALGYHQG